MTFKRQIYSLEPGTKRCKAPRTPEGVPQTPAAFGPMFSLRGWAAGCWAVDGFLLGCCSCWAVGLCRFRSTSSPRPRNASFRKLSVPGIRCESAETCVFHKDILNKYKVLENITGISGKRRKKQEKKQRNKTAGLLPRDHTALFGTLADGLW